MKNVNGGVKMKRNFLTVTMLAIFLGTSGFAQLKTQIQRSPTIGEAIHLQPDEDRQAFLTRCRDHLLALAPSAQS